MTTALITGASAGLGEQFAQLLARDGHDVVLVARSAHRLESLAERLRLHKVKAHVVAADLTQADAPAQIFEQLKERGLQIDILVNNAGYGSTGPFLDLPLQAEGDMVELNCNALLKLTHLFAGPMRERKAGKILNIASTAAFQAGPFMATYYATKAFVVSFSEALSHELKGTGVTVTCYCPGPTHTEFGARAGNDASRLFQGPGVAKAEDVARDAYEAMQQGEVLSIYGLLNWVSAQATRFSPRSVTRSIAATLNQKA